MTIPWKVGVYPKAALVHPASTVDQAFLQAMIGVMARTTGWCSREALSNV